jgi:hypothetical protein
MTEKCRDLYVRVRHFTRLTFGIMLWYVLNAVLLVRELGPGPYNLTLLVLTLLGACVVGVNLVRLRRLLRGQVTPDVLGRGYLVPAPWLVAIEDEYETMTPS